MLQLTCVPRVPQCSALPGAHCLLVLLILQPLACFTRVHILAPPGQSSYDKTHLQHCETRLQIILILKTPTWPISLLLGVPEDLPCSCLFHCNYRLNRLLVDLTRCFILSGFPMNLTVFIVTAHSQYVSKVDFKLQWCAFVLNSVVHSKMTCNTHAVAYVQVYLLLPYKKSMTALYKLTILYST